MPVHLRLNDKDTTRNPYINFVTALPGPRHDQALHRLQQLAAMAKPLMKDQAFHINSLEEYEHNKEFAGRCWENGEVIELVLTNANGEWIPLQYVLYVFCHELAHIKHMNHIPHLHGALTRHLKQLALKKQSEGYYGDGLWSSGRQLQDGGFKTGLGMNAAQQNLPENVCGGAFRRSRATRRPGRRSSGLRSSSGRKFKGPSLHTGAQTASNTRGGNRRVKIEVASSSSGSRLDGRDWFPVASAKNKDYKLDENSTFRKRTQSKDAREKRAAAAMARFAALQGASTDVNSEVKREIKEEIKRDEEDSVTEEEGGGDTDSDTDDRWLVGNDLGEERRPSPNVKATPEEDQFTQAGAMETPEQRKRRMQRFDDRHGSTTAAVSSANDNTWISLLDEAEDISRVKKRNQGSSAERQGKRVKVEDKGSSDDEILLVNAVSKKPSISSSTKKTSLANGSHIVPSTAPAEWTCLLCTLRNAYTAQRCAACDTSRGRTTLGA